MPAFDASSILHGWINYPPPNFPKLWDWIAEEIDAGRITISKVALEETGHRSPECESWLKARDVSVLPLTQAAVKHALNMKSALSIVNDRYHVNGVDENDLLIIATAKDVGCELVSNESKQPALPMLMSKYKIPAVCALPSVNVSCVDFLDVLMRSGKSFG